MVSWAIPEPSLSRQARCAGIPSQEPARHAFGQRALPTTRALVGRVQRRWLAARVHGERPSRAVPGRGQPRTKCPARLIARRALARRWCVAGGRPARRDAPPKTAAWRSPMTCFVAAPQSAGLPSPLSTRWSPRQASLLALLQPPQPAPSHRLPATRRRGHGVAAVHHTSAFLSPQEL